MSNTRLTVLCIMFNRYIHRCLLSQQHQRRVLHVRLFSSSSSTSTSAAITIPNAPIFRRAFDFTDRIAVHSSNRDYTYRQLINDASQVATALVAASSSRSLANSAVAYQITPSYEHVVVQWAVWMLGAVGVPLHATQADAELTHIVSDSKPVIIVIDSATQQAVEDVANRHQLHILRLPQLHNDNTNKSPLTISKQEFDMNHRAYIIYTSGTTGKPKGVITSHKMMTAQITALTTSWEWTPNDHILHVLPLHHVHGIINVLLCALWSGAKVTFLPRFDAEKVINSFININNLTLFMAVPTIYTKIINFYNTMNIDKQEAFRNACQKFRLMVSGSAALPLPVLELWKSITGHLLLERYGMSEFGMALSNPLHGIRKPGRVGKPLPGVTVKVIPQISDENDNNNNYNNKSDNTEVMSGELLVKGDNVFTEYLNRSDATRASFDSDQYFITGDIVSIDTDGDYKIIGRASVDVLKISGYKVSALDIERELLANNNISEVAVVGLPSTEYGQTVAALIVLNNNNNNNNNYNNNNEITAEIIKDWCKTRLASYQIPRLIHFVNSIPRNAMGKVNKKSLIPMLQALTKDPK